MEFDVILLRCGEIFLKGKNKGIFERKLISNIKALTSIESVKSLRGRFIAPFVKDHMSLRRVFGLTSYSPAVVAQKDIDSIKRKALEFVKSKQGTFKVETKRSDKSFPLKSPDVNQEVGMYIEENSGFSFSFENPSFIVNIEINQQGAYLYSDTIRCFGGIPTGIEGEVGLQVRDDNDILAGLLFMKRGCNIVVTDGQADFLQQFSPKEIKVNNSYEGVMVSGDTFDTLSKDTSIMKPLVAYSQEEIDLEFSKFKAALE